MLFSAIAIIGIWLVAWGGFTLSENSKMTAEKFRAYAHSVDLSRLSARERAGAINKLAAKLNALSVDERQQARMEGVWDRWFEQMTEGEKSTFLEATAPSGLLQMLAAFEKLTEDKRRRAFGDALKRLKDLREDQRDTGQSPPVTTPIRPPTFTPDMEKRVREIGLKTFYSESSAQTKTELAPILEELQRMMESGAINRGGPK